MELIFIPDVFVQRPGVSTVIFFTIINDAHLVSMNQYLFSSGVGLCFWVSIYKRGFCFFLAIL